jgi:tetratricopeptide (TPR) repeat protein
MPIQALIKVAVFASIVIVALLQQVNASTTSTGLLKKAQVLLEHGQNGPALTCLSTLIRKEPSPKAYACRAKAYGKLGQYKKQIDDLTSAIMVNPKDADLYKDRAFAYYQLGQLQKTIDDCSTVWRLKPTSSWAYSTAALAYEELGLFDKAVELRTKAFALKTPGALDLNQRAIDYESLNKYDLAQVDWQKANKLASASELAAM